MKLASDSEHNEELFTFDGKIVERAIKDIYKKKGFNGKDIGGKAGKALMFENYRVLSNAIDKGIKEAESSISIEVTDELKEALSDNALLFSGFKAYHTMREAGLSLQDKSTGGIKSFDEFKKDAEKVFKRQGLNLRAEYQHAVTTAQMATKWQEIEQDGDRYDLQYRTAGDDKVRAEHSALNGTTLPPSDKFWAEFYPPNGWGCRCQAVQVRKGKYTTSNSDKAIEVGRKMTSKPSEKIFRTNAGKTKKVFPDKHPNFPKGCGDCPVRGGQTKLYYDKDSDACKACLIINECRNSSVRNETKKVAKDLDKRNKAIQQLVNKGVITREDARSKKLDLIAKEKNINLPEKPRSDGKVVRIGTLPQAVLDDIKKRFGKVEDNNFYIVDRDICHAIRTEKFLDGAAVKIEEMNKVYDILKDEEVKCYYQKNKGQYVFIKSINNTEYIGYVFKANIRKGKLKTRSNFFTTAVNTNKTSFLDANTHEEIY